MQPFLWFSYPEFRLLKKATKRVHFKLSHDCFFVHSVRNVSLGKRNAPNQNAHHKERTFREEYVLLLKAFCIDYGLTL